MNLVLTKVWDGTLKGLKWMMIQFLILICVGLLYHLALLCYSLISDIGFREVLMSFPLFGKAGAYDWRLGLCLAIPIYSLLFGWWHAFFTKKSQRWTYFLPWLLLMAVSYLHVAQERDWYFQIITLDEYMLAGCLAPLFGILLYGIRQVNQKHHVI